MRNPDFAMSILKLSKQALREFTGYQQAARQARVLEVLGIRCARAADGSLIVLCVDLERRAAAGAVARREAEPHLEGLGRR